MILSKLKIVGGLALAGMFTLGVGAVAAQKLGGSGENAKVEKPADDTLDALIAKLKDQAQKSEVRTKQLEDELKAARAELEAAKSRSQAAPADPFEGRGSRPGSMGGQQTTAKKGTDLRSINKAEQEASTRGMMGGPTGGMMDMGGMGAGMMGMGGMGGGMGGMGGGMGGMDGGMGGGMGSGMGGGMGGMGGGMGGILGRQQSLATLYMDDCVIVHKPKSDKVSAYSTETGEWTSYEVPKGTDVSPVANPSVVALWETGEEIGQLATFVPVTGKWYPIDLKEPAKGRAMPLVGNQQAVYAIGRRVYAFSVPARAWDVLELEEGAKPVPVVSNSRAAVEHADHIYIFSLKTGKWTDFNAKTGQEGPPEAK